VTWTDWICGRDIEFVDSSGDCFAGVDLSDVRWPSEVFRSSAGHPVTRSIRGSKILSEASDKLSVCQEHLRRTFCKLYSSRFTIHLCSIVFVPERKTARLGSCDFDYVIQSGDNSLGRQCGGGYLRRHFRGRDLKQRPPLFPTIPPGLGLSSRLISDPYTF
jgi:hypothetical protein